METSYLHLPIQTLCVISTLGKLRPLWFRYEDAEHRIMKVDILNILSTKEVQLAGNKSLVFTCEASMDNNMAIVELQYMINTHKWILKKKVA